MSVLNGDLNDKHSTSSKDAGDPLKDFFASVTDKFSDFAENVKEETQRAIDDAIASTDDLGGGPYELTRDEFDDTADDDYDLGGGSYNISRDEFDDESSEMYRVDPYEISREDPSEEIRVDDSDNVSLKDAAESAGVSSFARGMAAGISAGLPRGAGKDFDASVLRGCTSTSVSKVDDRSAETSNDVTLDFN